MTLKWLDDDGEHCMHVVRGGESRCANCGEKVVRDGRRSTARAQLWITTYHWALRRYCREANTRGLAVAAANNAVVDFDEHYLGRKAGTKG